MNLHLVALPHTQVTADYQSCAYTQKVAKFCRMMSRRGWNITLYAGEQNDEPVHEHVELVSERERTAWFGDGFDTVLTPLEWDAGQPYWKTFNARAIHEIQQRVKKGDLILLTTGTQWPIHQFFSDQISCEWTVGYTGICTPFCAFESQSFMHTVYAKRSIDDGRDFDTVIPNFFDPDEFPTVSTGGDYLLFVGRLIRRKGVAVAAEIAAAAGMPLKVAGPGATEWTNGRIVAPDVVIEGDHVEYLGEITIQERAELMAGAHALLAPTVYLEPFGGVAVEAQMCGTPAITTDHGAFMETVHPWFRFRNLQGALDAVDMAGRIDRPRLREQTVDSYSLEEVAPRYEEWFHRLGTLWGKGWYETLSAGPSTVVGHRVTLEA